MDRSSPASDPCQEVWAARRKDFAPWPRPSPARRWPGDGNPRAEILEHLWTRPAPARRAPRFILKVARRISNWRKPMPQCRTAAGPGAVALAADPVWPLAACAWKPRKCWRQRLATGCPAGALSGTASLPEDLAQARAEAAQHESEAPGVPES
jgi:hypothetical protein